MKKLIRILLIFGALFKISSALTIEGDFDEEICENTAIDQIIGRFSARNGIAPYIFTIVGEISAYVKIENDGSGNDRVVVKLNRPLDRETIGGAFRNIEVVVTDDDATEATKTITAILIDDVNDNTPIFNGIPYTASVYEYPWTSDLGIEVAVSDADTGSAATVDVSTTNDRLALGSLGDNRYNLLLKTGEKLDFEDSPVVTADIIAADRGGGCGDQSSRSTQTTAVINVLDGPDQGPFFVSTYDVTLEENSNVGTEVVKVEAIDRDYSLDWKMKYEIVPNTVAEKWFEINETTGQISVKKTIDREDDEALENNGNFQFQVKATEIVPEDFELPPTAGVEVPFPFSANTPVTVRINDFNDNAPIFYDDSSGNLEEKSTFVTSMDENTPNFIFVPGLSIFVQDKDQGQNADFSLSTNSDVFDVVPNEALGTTNVELRVVNSSQLDYEATKQFTVQITATEKQPESPKSVVATVTINLNDVNDNSPKFDESTLIANINEDAFTRDVTVIQVQATDDDDGDFKKITYSLQENELFAIDNTSGVVTLKDELNHELNDFYSFIVTATDGGGSSTNGNLQITVLDVNDNAPVFQRSSYFAILEEGEEAFATPLQISASDIDEANNPNSEIEFDIIAGDLKDYFEVTKETESTPLVAVGEVRPNKPIDLEELDPKTFSCKDGVVTTTVVVEARDGGNPSLSSNVTITITIQDVNDNTPVFDQPEYRSSIPEFSELNTNVLEVSATDNDVCSINSEIFYQIDPSDATIISSFSINSQTGNISVRNPILDRDTREKYEFLVFAVSGDRRGNATVIITLTDVNDKLPMFVSNNSHEVQEEQMNGTVVWRIEAEDTDVNSNLQYTMSKVQCFTAGNLEITDCVDPFLMETDEAEQVGNLVVAGRINREAVQRYLMTVTVEDLNGDVPKDGQTVSKVFEVILLDINDNAPVFVTDPNSFAVREESPEVVIGTVFARDDDEGVNGEVSYKIDPADKEYVTIDPVTGSMSTVAGIDRETVGDLLNVTVIATDGGTPSKETEIVLPIRILDINDANPVFVNESYSADISEDASIEEEVITVNATDGDVGTAAVLIYLILEGDIYGQFDIDRLSGVIKVVKPLDREITSSYILTVAARDDNGIGDYRQTTVAVTINVEDVNDEPPVFFSKSFPTSVLENAKVGDEIRSQFASDEDSGINAEFVYSITNDEDHFEIDSGTGIVRLAESILDGEEEYFVEIMAKDKGTPSLNTSYVLEVTVIDVNTHDPEFVNLPPDSAIVVDENLDLGSVVYQVNATDADRGANGEVTYSMTSEDNAFQIGPEDGIIITREVFDAERKSSYEVTVIATDRGPINEVGSSTVTFSVKIGDDNDQQPYYPRGENEQTIKITEETTSAEAVDPPQTVKAAADDDIDESNQENYYFIIGGSASSQFDLDSTSRILTLNSPLNREEEPQYDLVVTVSGDKNYNPPKNDVTWDEVQDENTMLHVFINLTDINDNSPVFEKELYLADITFDSQPNPEAIITQVKAIDEDEGSNAEVEYAIVNTKFILNGAIQQENLKTFDIRKARDGMSGDIYLADNINGNTDGEYEVEVSASDNEGNSGTSKVNIGIITSDESLTLFSTIPPEELDRDEFASELGKLLDATVIVESVSPHIAAEGDLNDLAKSDIRFHAKASGSASELIPKDEIAGVLSQQDSFGFLQQFGISGVETTEEEDITQTTQLLKIILLVLIVAVVIVIICFTISILCMRRKYQRKLRVAEATTSAANEIADMNKQVNISVLPNTNDYAGSENPLFVENQKNAIDLEGWFNHQESQDDDDEIDDNAVDDSAIVLNSDKSSTQSDDGQNLEDGFEIDFGKADNAKLAAALNAANEMRGGENLTYIFDQEMDNTAM